jgi:hypothetical protein
MSFFIPFGKKIFEALSIQYRGILGKRLAAYGSLFK